jgi:hypothetical protein
MFEGIDFSTLHKYCFSDMQKRFFHAHKIKGKPVSGLETNIIPLIKTILGKVFKAA